MTDKLTLTLFHAGWCGHCVKLMPEWKKLKNIIEKNDYKTHDLQIEINEYTDTDMKNEKVGKHANINGENIMGFPTLKLTLNVKGESKDYDYEEFRLPKKSKIMASFIDNIGKSVSGLNRTNKKHNTKN